MSYALELISTLNLFAMIKAYEDHLSIENYIPIW
jgi:hypothetical protein